MKVKRDEVLGVLDKVSAGLTREGIAGEEPRYIITEDTIMSYNDQICIVYPFEFDFQCSVPASEFYSVFSKIKEDTVAVSYSKEKVRIRTKSSMAEISCFSIDEEMALIDSLQIEKVRFRKLPEDFVEALGMCVFSASADLSQLALSCLCIKGSKVVSSDDLRISIFEMDAKVKDSFLIPARIVKELMAFPVTGYFLGEAWCYFSTPDGVIFVSRIIDEGFPEVDEHFEFKGRKVKFPTNIDSSLDLASVMVDTKYELDQSISVELMEGNLKIRSEKELGWIEVTTNCSYKGKTAIRFDINPIFLKKILDKVGSIVIGKDRALFETSNFKHLISLM